MDSLLSIAFMFIALVAQCHGLQQLYVSASTGSDSNPGTLAQPLQSIEQALLLAASKQFPTSEIYLINDGLHLVNATLNIGAQHGAVSLSSHSSRATISGAIQLSNFQRSQTDPRIVTTQVSEAYRNSSSLYVNGQRAIPARMPNIGNAYSRGLGDDDTLKWQRPLSPCTSTCPETNKLGFVYANNDLNASWHRLQDVRVLTMHAWDAELHAVKTVFEANKTVLFTETSSSIAIGQYEHQGGRRYVVENVLEGLDAPGEFYLDKGSGLLSYVMRADETVETLDAQLAVVSSIFSLSGASNVSVHDVMVMYADEPVSIRTRPYASSAMIDIESSSNVSISRCTLAHGSGDGIHVGGGVAGLTIEQSVVQDFGYNGIEMTGADAERVHIHHNLINDTGHIGLFQPCSIHIRGRSSIVVEYNQLSHSPYAGIKVGWQTGTPTPPSSIISPVFSIQFNRVHDYGLGVLSDFGGIYLSSNDNLCFEKATCYLPSLVYNNIVSAGRHYNYGSEGIYMDEQVSGQNITHNVFYDIGDSGTYMHCGAAHFVDNNVIADIAKQGSGGAVKGCNSGGNPSWPNITHGFSFTRNIVYLSTSDIASGKDFRDTLFADNVYFSTEMNTHPLSFPGGVAWKAWQQHNESSAIRQDPLFVNASAYDFHLRSTSPAWGRGFQHIDLDFSAGPSPDM